ncbi:flavodoxin [Sporomusa malonica]|uniref:Flavodoxin n=1 Tax=Sporomusa malonica TaxID=112901 RepID=A0A1W2BD62_9FIRM|nr:flavodoxin [Sporomusa malonica]SMC70784.1 flavodoxin, short chain [Sporomusa malonica]
MKKIVVIYWSGTGNTEQMATAVADGAKNNDGVSVELIAVSNASKSNVLEADAVALGCPSMGDEVLEETEMEPFVKTLQAAELTGKPLALFGSYGWGEGQWMTDWVERMKGLGAVLVADGLIVQEVPNEEGLSLCKELGMKLALSAVKE